MSSQTSKAVTTSATTMQASKSSNANGAAVDSKLGSIEPSDCAVALPPVAQSQSMPPHFGDIMAPRETRCVLPSAVFPSPFQRIFLTCNGNLQRVLSAYYNQPVSIDIVYNNPITDPIERNAALIKLREAAAGLSSNVPPVDDDALLFDRRVHLVVCGKVACVAISVVAVSNPETKRLVLEEGVGIGQIFRYRNVLPEFALLDVGRQEQWQFGDESGQTNGIWRRYMLAAVGVQCDIQEYFPGNVLDLLQ